MKPSKRWMSLLLALLLWALLAAHSLAAGETGSLTLHYLLNGSTFRLYRVAAYDADGSFRLCDGYDTLPLDWSPIDTEDWYRLANDLDTAVIAESIPSDRTVVTDDTGTAVLNALPYGLWLIAGKTETREQTTYTTQPLLVAIPGTAEDGSVSSDRTLTISKYTKETKPESLQLSVVKVWEDNRSTSRPAKIEVTLYRDADRYDTVTLNASNNWRYVWDKLEPGHSWRVAETPVPTGYAVTYSRDGYAFYITNTRSTPPPPPPEIPQTGLNWMPVTILVPLSLLCLVIGVWRRRSEEKP